MVGLQSLQNMSRMDASLMNANASQPEMLPVHGQSAAAVDPWRWFISTTQRLKAGRTKPFTRSDRLTILGLQIGQAAGHSAVKDRAVNRKLSANNFPIS